MRVCGEFIASGRFCVQCLAVRVDGHTRLFFAFCCGVNSFFASFSFFCSGSMGWVDTGPYGSGFRLRSAGYSPTPASSGLCKRPRVCAPQVVSDGISPILASSWESCPTGAGAGRKRTCCSFLSAFSRNLSCAAASSALLAIPPSEKNGLEARNFPKQCQKSITRQLLPTFRSVDSREGAIGERWACEE